MSRGGVSRERSPSPLAQQAREASGVTSSLLLGYLDRVGGADAVDGVLRRCGLTGCAQELRDENCWFSWETKVALFEATAEVLGKPDFVHEMASMALDLNVAGALKIALRTLGSPQFVYRNIVRANARFNGSHSMELIELDAGHARIRFAEIGDAGRFHRLDCEYTAAMLPLVPRLFGLPPATLSHPHCAGDGADACVYHLSWREHATTARRTLVATALAAAGVSASALFAPVLLPGAAGIAAVAGAMLGRAHVLRRRERWRHLERQVEDHADVAQRLFASLQDLVSDLRLEEVLAKVTRNAQAAVGGSEFALLVRDGGRHRCQGSSGLPVASMVALELWADATPRAAQQSLLLDDVTEVEALAPLCSQRALPLRSVASAPLTAAGETLGVLVALGGHDHRFLPRDLEVLESYGAQVAIALTNARLYDAARDLAARDPLTGLLNHRSFHETLDASVEGGAERASVVVIDLDDFKRVNDEDGHSAGDLLLQGVARVLGEACGPRDLAFRVGGDEFALVLRGCDEEAAVATARRVCAEIGALDPRTGASAGVAAVDSAGGAAKGELLAEADRRLYSAKVGDLGARATRAASDAFAGAAAVEVLAAAMAAHDGDTADHSDEVACLADRVAARAGAGAHERRVIGQAARVHDIGKLAVPPEILRKPGPLTPAEWGLIREHPRRGAEIPRQARGLEDLAAVVVAAHERWDGAGYPDGLAGEAIPLGARVIAVCDAYHAMTSDRPYRAALPHEAAIEELHRCVGSQFDPAAVRALVDELGEARAAAAA
jgi:diguanylate cyclase (GGDEF)-like protein